MTPSKRPFLFLVMPFSLGIAAADIYTISFFYAFLLCAASLALSLLSIRKRLASHVFLYIAALFLGMACSGLSNTISPNHISNFIDELPRKVFLKGSVYDDPVSAATFYNKEKTSFIFKTEYLKDQERSLEVEGLVKVDIYSSNKSKIDFGDELILEGLLSKPFRLKNPGLFDYSKYLRRKGIYAVLNVRDGFSVSKVGVEHRAGYVKGLSYRLRRGIILLIDRYMPPPYDSFLKAILVGDRSELGEGLMDDFVKTGTVHIIAISGLNVGLIAALFLSVFGILRVPRKINLVSTVIFLVFYSFAVGSNPPIVRAVITFSIFVLGSLLNRDSDALNSLAIAAFLILLWNANELFNPSFQLSFLSLASAIIFTPRIDKLLRLDAIDRVSRAARMRLYLLKAVSISAASWLGTCPLVASYFNIVSPISIAANLFAVPALFVLTAASFLFLLASPLIPLLGAILAHGLVVMEKALFFINHILSSLPLSHFRIPSPSSAFLIFYYVLLLLSLLPVATLRPSIARYRKEILIGCLIIFNVLLWKSIIFENGRLMITFLDVGQGDSIVIESPGKRAILIDGGSGGEDGRFDMGRHVIAPFLWNRSIRRLDAVVATHFHEDHLGGLIYILKNFEVGCVIDNGASVSPGNRLYDEYKKILRLKDIRRVVAREGDEIKGFGDAKIFVLNPKKEGGLVDSNDNSLVLRFVYSGRSVLLCGDITADAMERLLSYDRFLQSDICKIPHHGGFASDAVISRNFFEKISPHVSVISTGRKYHYDYSSRKTVDILTSLNSECYITNRDGGIILYIDKNRHSVRTKIAKKN